MYTGSVLCIQNADLNDVNASLIFPVSVHNTICSSGKLVRCYYLSSNYNFHYHIIAIIDIYISFIMYILQNNNKKSPIHPPSPTPRVESLPPSAPLPRSPFPYPSSPEGEKKKKNPARRIRTTDLRITYDNLCSTVLRSTN